MNWIACLLFIVAAPLSACCMVPRGYVGDVDQSAQRVVLVHRGPTEGTPGYQEMIIKVQPFFQDAPDNPEYMAWVITLPNNPERYDIADDAALSAGAESFDRLYQLARQQWADKSGFKWPEWLPTMLTQRDAVAGKAEGNVIEDAAVEVGPYTITPVRAVGADAVKELNAYLGERGFPAEDEDHLAYFVENNFTFLCVRIDPPAGQKTLGRNLDLPPLVLGFETDKPYYPGRFSSQQGNFALDLTVITDRPLDTESVAQQRSRLKAIGRGYVQLINLYSMLPLPDALTGFLTERTNGEAPERWYINRIESHGFNSQADDDAKPISSWEDDVFFKLGDTTDELPGFWYYADQDISFFERFFREHALAMFFSIGAFFFISLFIKTRINRKRYLAEQAKAKAA